MHTGQHEAAPDDEVATHWQGPDAVNLIPLGAELPTRWPYSCTHQPALLPAHITVIREHWVLDTTAPPDHAGQYILGRTTNQLEQLGIKRAQLVLT